MSTGYDAGMTDRRVTILNKVVKSGFGETTGYAPATCKNSSGQLKIYVPGDLS